MFVMLWAPGLLLFCFSFCWRLIWLNFFPRVSPIPSSLLEFLSIEAPPSLRDPSSAKVNLLYTILKWPSNQNFHQVKRNFGLTLVWRNPRLCSDDGFAKETLIPIPEKFLSSANLDAVSREVNESWLSRRIGWKSFYYFLPNMRVTYSSCVDLFCRLKEQIHAWIVIDFRVWKCSSEIFTAQSWRRSDEILE